MPKVSQYIDKKLLVTGLVVAVAVAGVGMALRRSKNTKAQELGASL